jgi:hypothetical protein
MSLRQPIFWVPSRCRRSTCTLAPGEIEGIEVAGKEPEKQTLSLRLSNRTTPRGRYSGLLASSRATGHGEIAGLGVREANSGIRNGSNCGSKLVPIMESI